MKNNILLLLLLAIVYTCSGSTNFTIKFVGNTNNLAIEKNGEIFISNLYSNPLILNTINFEEPCKMSIVDIKGNKKIFFYLDNQSSEISIRTSDLTVQFTNSKLNTEYNQYLHFIDSFNVLMDSNRIAYLKFKDLEFNAANYVASLKYSARIKSLEQEQQMYLYNWCLKHTKSFVCFDFIQYQLDEKQLDSALVKKLFSCLDSSLHNYPTYKKYKLLFENKEAIDTLVNNEMTTKIETIDSNKLTSLKTLPFKTKSTLRIIGKRIKNYQLIIDNEVIIDSLKTTNVINKNIAEPISVLLINLNDSIALANRTVNSMFFYLDTGVHDIKIDIDKSTIFSKTSKLNNEHNLVWQIKNHYDSIMEIATYNDSIQNSKLGFRSNNNLIDSISRLYHRAYYNKCLLMPNSFVSLDFVSFLLDSYFQVGVTKEEVLKLFNSLGNNLKKYPTYTETKKNIEENLLKRNDDKTREVNKPLWNPR